MLHGLLWKKDTIFCNSFYEVKPHTKPEKDPTKKSEVIFLTNKDANVLKTIAKSNM